jgi:sterol desaturase/sphingolipid hydroxylase (fatty acid hydroxylase superfamily)
MDLSRFRIITTVLVILASIIIILLERTFPYTKNQKFFREGFFEDFFLYTFFQSYILGLLISWFINYIDYHTRIANEWTIRKFPIAVQFTFFFITHDFYIYWFHRLQHRSKILWRIHEAHHSNKEVDWLAGSRSHALEILINQTVEFLPIILLGASPVIPVVKGAVDAVWGMYIHSNINVKSGMLQFFINGPEMHRWHHSDKVVSVYNKNFSTKLAVWDWFFKTAYKPGSLKPEHYGLSEVDFPKNYFKQQLFAFRKFKEGKI